MQINQEFLHRLGISVPIIQAPMAGANDVTMAMAVADAGGLGSIPCAMITPEMAHSSLQQMQLHTKAPVNLNFFCHEPAVEDAEREQVWRDHLRPYYEELGLDPSDTTPAAARAPFGDGMCEVVESLRPGVVSFHFGLPGKSLVDRVKAAGNVVMCSATTVKEAVWLEQNGCDVVIAQGYEAGGHRGMFLTESLSSQIGTLSLVPQVTDAVTIPVIAAGGITDGRGMAAALMLGADCVQIGTAYLFSDEAIISSLHRQALATASENETALTNVFSGRPARSLMNRIMQETGPVSDRAPSFPTAGNALAALKTQAEKQQCADFSSLWSGQSAALGQVGSATQITQRIARQAASQFEKLANKE